MCTNIFQVGRRLHLYLLTVGNQFEEKKKGKTMEEGSVTSPLLLSQARGGASFISSDFCSRFWVESKALWRIAGAAIFSRLAIYALNVITQAFIGHVGDLELAAFSMVIGVIVGFTSAIIVSILRLKSFSIML